MQQMHGTTILGIRKNNKIAIAGDGQVSLQHTIVKENAIKIRRIYNDKVVTGFAGATADAFTLFEKFEAKLKEYKGDLKRAAVEMTREWRSDKILRKLEAMIIVADKKDLLLLSGTGDVLEPHDDVIAIGSGGNYALSAAKALKDNTDLEAKEIAIKSVEIAADICIYTNKNIIVQEA